ncbi:MAG: flagellar biosynthesis protein FlhF [Halomonas sp.]
MSVMRFTGATSREAMRQVRAALGDDALILANRPTEEGVEILAMTDDAVGGLSNGARSAADARMPPEAPAPAPREATARATGGNTDLQAMSAQLLSEMQDMRALLAREQARRQPETDCAGRLRRILREAGFSHAFARSLVTGLPSELEQAPAEDERPLAWLQRRLADRLTVGRDGDAFFRPPGILALVGPTGVGKTTTTAKLAARYVERHGTDRVALVTTDSFRIGAHEQLRIYAELLGIPMVALDSDQPVDSLASRLMGRRWVIVDTVGMSQRDQRMVEQIAQLQGGRVRVQMVLLLNAASQPETLDEVVRRYRDAAVAADARLDRCLLTKQDEACRLAPALEALIRHDMTLCFVSDGQRVPEDLRLPDPASLAARALATRSPLAEEEAPASPGASPARPPLLSQGRRIAASLTRLRGRLGGFAALEALWDLTTLPAEVQEQRLPALLRRSADAAPPGGLLWAPARPSGGTDWRLPHAPLNAEGLPELPLRLQHQQPAGDLERLASALDGCDAASLPFQLFPTLPPADVRERLSRLGIRWMAKAQPASRVLQHGEPHPLSRLFPLARREGTLTTRLRGRAITASLSRLPVTLPPTKRAGTSHDECFDAWHASLHDAESGRPLGQRLWLSPVSEAGEVEPMLLAALQGEALAPLTRQAMHRLAEWLPTGTRAELMLSLAASLAAVATHLEHARDEAAMDLRAELLGLLGSRRRRRDTALLQALLELFATREAIRDIQAGGGAT